MKEELQILLISVVIFLAICLYGKYRCANPDYKDPFMGKLDIMNSESFLGDLDGWSILHFLFFGMLGYLYPNQFLLAMVIGIGWELFEHLLVESRPGILGGFGDCVTTDPKTQGSWWYGRISDILVNALGFLAGIGIRKLSSNP